MRHGAGVGEGGAGVRTVERAGERGATRAFFVRGARGLGGARPRCWRAARLACCAGLLAGCSSGAPGLPARDDLRHHAHRGGRAGRHQGRQGHRELRHGPADRERVRGQDQERPGAGQRRGRPGHDQRLDLPELQHPGPAQDGQRVAVPHRHGRDPRGAPRAHAVSYGRLRAALSRADSAACGGRNRARRLLSPSATAGVDAAGECC